MGNPEQAVASPDYFRWFRRVVGFDVALPLIVSSMSVVIATWLGRRPPADIIALVGLPVVAFVIRLGAGSRQITGNCCGNAVRMCQFASLIVALFILAFVDFFVALKAFVVNGNPPQITDAPIFISSVVATYFVLVGFAMYPGRHPKNCSYEPYVARYLTH